jgi:hypothetical protein
VLATTFTGVNLAMSKYTPPSGPAEKVYGFSLLNVEIALLGIPLIPGVSNFVLFADPAQGNASNLGWLMTLKSPIIPPAA